jgi:hypothetical protein
LDANGAPVVFVFWKVPKPQKEAGLGHSWSCHVLPTTGNACCIGLQQFVWVEFRVGSHQSAGCFQPTAKTSIVIIIIIIIIIITVPCGMQTELVSNHYSYNTNHGPLRLHLISFGLRDLYDDRLR